jgi:protein-tyrosine phosphatase
LATDSARLFVDRSDEVPSLFPPVPRVLVYDDRRENDAAAETIDRNIASRPTTRDCSRREQGGTASLRSEFPIAEDRPVRGPETFVDTHCHLLPGVDDGAADWEEALAMARQAVADGISTVVATPHQLGRFRRNDGRVIRARTSHLRDFLVQNGLQLEVLPGAELRIEPDMIEGIREGELLTLADRGRYVLLELPHEVYLPLDGLLANLRRAGLSGILAHVERNQGILAQPSAVDGLVAAGCLLQVTAASVTGAFGADVQRLAERLIQRRLVHFIVTDAHNAKSRRPQMRPAFERITELAGYDTALTLCCRNPAAVIHDETIRPASHEPPKKRFAPSRWFGWNKAS